MVTASAGPKIVGYLFQFHRALYRLFSSPSSAVIGIETLDDVVAITRLPDGSLEIEFEQDKHSVQESGHPYQDSSKNFWHTLHIWLDTVRTKSMPGKPTAFCFVTNTSVHANSFVHRLALASDDQTVASCVQELRSRSTHITGKAEASAKAVGTYSDEELAYVIQHIRVLDEHGTKAGGTPKQAVIDMFHLPPSLEAKAEEIYQSILGMLIEFCEQAWLKKRNVWVDKAPFATRLHSEIQRLGMKKFVEQPWISLDLSKYIEGDNDNHRFLRQLRRFDAPLVICNSAINHYWGFYAERIRLIDEGDVLPSDWDARNSELHDRWLQKQGHVSMHKKPTDNDIIDAKNLYTATMNSDYLAKLGKFETSHSYFTSGNYHSLANDPNQEFYIYWHDDFGTKSGEEL